jgi:hypothetical protein
MVTCSPETPLVLHREHGIAPFTAADRERRLGDDGAEAERSRLIRLRVARGRARIVRCEPA